MTPELDKAALGVAWARCETGHERALVELAIQAYKDEAGLVERSALESVEEEMAGVERALDTSIKDGLRWSQERDQAREEAEELGKQLAALRVALYELLREHECLLISIGNDGSRLSIWHKKAHATLAATAKAAAQYQPVPESCVVVSKRALAPFERWVRDHLSDGINWVPDAYLLSGALAGPPDLTAGDIRRLCAPAKPEPEDGG